MCRDQQIARLIKRDAARSTLASHKFSRLEGRTHPPSPHLGTVSSAVLLPVVGLLIQRVTSIANYLPSLRWSGKQALFDQG